jgi:hypothetical protein
MDNTAAQADRNGLSTIAGAKFFHDVLDMPFDCLFRDEEQSRNVAIAIAASNFLQDLNLSFA